MNETLIFVKIVPLAIIPVGFLLVEMSLKLFFYNIFGIFYVLKC